MWIALRLKQCQTLTTKVFTYMHSCTRFVVHLRQCYFKSATQIVCPSEYQKNHRRVQCCWYW